MSSGHLPGLDPERLRGYLDTHVPGLTAGPLTGEVVPGGRSNLTYVVTDGHSRWVVRRPPLGHVLPTAHDMTREHRVISALAPTPVPVPRTIALCQDPDVLGAPFYVMEYVAGTPYRSDAQLAELGPERTRMVAERLVDTLVDLHAVDPAAVNLEDFGRPRGFLERQVRRWKKQLDASHSRELPGVGSLHDRLVSAVPGEEAPAIVHGDFRLDNVLVKAGRITAVLDWEMSTLGDPLTDLALMIAYAETGKIGPSVVSTVSTAPGYPDTGEVAGRYAQGSGRDVSNLNWYVGFAFFKLAVVLEGIYYRFCHGQTVGEGFEAIGDAVLPLIRLGNDTLKD